MIRRQLLTGSASIAVLTGCGAGIPSSSRIAAVIADANIILSAVQNVLASLRRANLPGLAPGTLAIVEDAVAGVRSIVGAIGTTLPTTDPSSLSGLIGDLAGYVNAITLAIAGLPFVPPAVAAYLNAAAIILPVLTAAVQITVNTIKPPAPPQPIPSIDAARAVATTPAS